MATPDHCILEHQVFTALGPALFRRAPTDGIPVMVVPMGAREAMLPLRGLQREFGIAEDSTDGRMLGLIVASLDFVAGLQIGDRLPAEVLTGEASWEPSQQCRDMVRARLRLQLIAWLHPEAGAGAATAGTLQTAGQRSGPAPPGAAAFGRAAEVLGLADAEAVVRLVEQLAEELAYIETLRGSLLQRVQGLGARLIRLGSDLRGDRNRIEMLTPVQRLMTAAIRQLAGRFDEVDAQTGEIVAALRDAGQQQVLIRTNRDWLYRCQRAWDPVLREWDRAGAMLADGVWQLVAAIYQFLAPRHMPVSEWAEYNVASRQAAAPPAAKVMTW